VHGDAVARALVSGGDRPLDRERVGGDGEDRDDDGCLALGVREGPLAGQLLDDKRQWDEEREGDE
jgi:hypothetical protein